MILPCNDALPVYNTFPWLKFGIFFCKVNFPWVYTNTFGKVSYFRFKIFAKTKTENFREKMKAKTFAPTLVLRLTTYLSNEPCMINIKYLTQLTKWLELIIINVDLCKNRTIWYKMDNFFLCWDPLLFNFHNSMTDWIAHNAIKSSRMHLLCKNIWACLIPVTYFTKNIFVKPSIRADIRLYRKGTYILY
jgi:hypothetical protein